MTVTINLNRKTLIVAFLTALLFIGVNWAYAAHDDPNIVHACVNSSSGTIKIVQGASECANNEAALALASESALIELQNAMSALQNQVTTAQDKADTALATANAAQATADDLADMLVHFSRDGDQVYITGANLHVLNGSGTTDGPPNSLGNLIVGYNELRNNPDSPDIRSGSHMLVVGEKNNYSSFGGIVVGYHNETSGDYASVSGGTFNEASGRFASVSGGNINVASGTSASVSGGGRNVASFGVASVSGGFGNEASGPSTSVSGGFGRQATDLYDWAAGDYYFDYE